MSASSALTDDIFVNILKYVLSQGDDKGMDIVQQLSPYLKLGSRWKKAADKLLCYECVIQGHEDNKIHRWNNLTLAQMASLPNIMDIRDKVETVSILTSTEELVNNWLLCGTRKDALDKLVFSNASSLYLQIVDSLDDGYDSAYSYDSYDSHNRPLRPSCAKIPGCGKAWQNIMQLVNWAHMLAPNVQEIAVSFSISSSGYFQAKNDIVQSFRHLFDKTLVCALELDSQVPWVFNAPEISFLTRLNIRWLNSSVVEEKIITSNCKSLQELVVRMDSESLRNLWRIIVNHDQYVYSNLRKLTLVLDEQLDEPLVNPTHIADEHAPFPSLTHLKLETCYPLGDCALFRGNFAKLQYLDMDIDVNSALVLAELELSETPDSLRHAKFYFPRHPEDPPSGMSQKLMNKIRHDSTVGVLPRNLQTLGLCGKSVPPTFVPNIMKRGFTSLRSLNLMDMHLEAAVVYKLVCSIPTLKHLHAAFVYLDKACAGRSANEIAEMLASKYPCASESKLYEIVVHRPLELSRDTQLAYRELAAFDVVFSLLCPSFKRLKLVGGSQCAYEKVCEMARREDTSMEMDVS